MNSKNFKLETDLSETKLQLNYIERDFKRQEEGMGTKLKEMDRLYKENETLREELTAIQSKFDFDALEIKLA